ncbi:MAG: LON peptidase substrate-binding domain-containing protein [Alphaproteobacteria bacterium]
MSGRNRFEPRFEELPDILPVFPLAGVLLLPGGKLPLNIFEPRYLNMVSDALAGPRLIGMIQPKLSRGEAGLGDFNPPLYAMGCAGRITSFAETEDGRYMITLTGLCRFRTIGELSPRDGYRRVTPDWGPYRADMIEPRERVAEEIDRARLLKAIRAYFRVKEIKTDWEAVEGSETVHLVNTLAMSCPFDPPEKQALLEAEDFRHRAEIAIALLEMGAAETEDDETPFRRQ